MLILTRRPGEGLILYTSDGEIYLDFDLKDHQIKVAIDAPDCVDVVWDEMETQKIPVALIYWPGERSTNSPSDNRQGIQSTDNTDRHNMLIHKAVPLAQPFV